MSGSRKELTLKEKVDVLNYLETHSQRNTAAEFGISKTCVSNIKKRKLEYLDRIENESGDMCRKVRKNKNEDVNKATLIWYCKMRESNVQITGPIIQAAARGFAKQFDVADFHASAGWLDSFKRRNSIVLGGSSVTADRTDNVNMTDRVGSSVTLDRTANVSVTDDMTDRVGSSVTADRTANVNMTDNRTAIVNMTDDMADRVGSNVTLDRTANVNMSDEVTGTVGSSVTQIIITDYHHGEDVFNAVECELLFQSMPQDENELEDENGRLDRADDEQEEDESNDSLDMGALIIEGKTKQVFDLPKMPGHCLVLSKDRITAGDGVKSHQLVGKAAISNRTNGKVFEILNSVGMRTAFVRTNTDTSFIARKCQMIPIEWVTRRLATGSYLKRHVGVPEGYRFAPVKLETFFKDDANHDPQWSTEQVISAAFAFNGRKIGSLEVDIIKKTTVLVFEVLEKAWATKNCALIDMKVEFGIDENGEILLADIIDSDSWRLWPSGDKRLMVDKQVYRNLGATVTDAELDQVLRNFEWVALQLDTLLPSTSSDHLIAILMGSPSDKEHCEKIKGHCAALGLNAELRVTSAHKGTEDTLAILRKYEAMPIKVIIIAVAGRSNGLGPVAAGNCALPVINCPPIANDSSLDRDIWSSLAVPSGLGCATLLYPETAALHAATMLALSNYAVWARLRVKQLHSAVGLKMADKGVTQ